MYLVCFYFNIRFSTIGRRNVKTESMFSYKQMYFLAHLSRRLKGELIVYQSSCRLAVCLSVCLCVNIFKLEYLCNQWANRNEILSEPSLGWGKGCIRFWARSNRNSSVHDNADSSHRVIMWKMLSAL